MKNVLNYFVRKAFGLKSTATAEDKTLFGHLLRIKRNIQGVYDWLYGRCPADAWWLARRMPMTEAVTSADGSSGSTPVKLRPVLQNSDNLLAHLRLLDGRKISNGYADGTPANDGLPDGVSLARLLCDSSLQPTELIDDNVGWVVNHLSANTQFKLSIFPNLKKLSLRCREINNRASYSYPLLTSSSLEEISFPNLEVITEADRGCVYQCQALTKVSFPKLHTLYSGWNTNHNYDGILVECNAIKSVTLPSLKRFENRQSSGSYNCIMYNNAALEELIMPNLQELYHNSVYQHTYCVSKCPSIKKIMLGTIKEFKNIYIVDNQCSDLLHIEFGQGTCTNIYLHHWNPTNKGAEFLSNFLHFIAERVAVGNYTLTLSAAVYAALEQQEGQTILALLNTKGWTVASA